MPRHADDAVCAARAVQRGAMHGAGAQDDRLTRAAALLSPARAVMPCCRCRCYALYYARVVYAMLNARCFYAAAAPLISPLAAAICRFSFAARRLRAAPSVCRAMLFLYDAVAMMPAEAPFYALMAAPSAVCRVYYAAPCRCFA